MLVTVAAHKQMNGMNAMQHACGVSSVDYNFLDKALANGEHLH
jgi:hypothetical protein